MFPDYPFLMTMIPIRQAVHLSKYMFGNFLCYNKTRAWSIILIELTNCFPQLSYSITTCKQLPITRNLLQRKPSWKKTTKVLWRGLSRKVSMDVHPIFLVCQKHIVILLVLPMITNYKFLGTHWFVPTIPVIQNAVELVFFTEVVSH